MIPQATRMKLRSSFGSLMLTLFLWAFVLLITRLAVLYLIRISSTPWYAIPSALGWLGLIGWWHRRGISEVGLSQHLRNQVRNLSLRHFVEVQTLNGKPSVLQFGFRLFGIRIIDLRLATDLIVEVEWTTGWRSVQNQRDMDDWQVWLWYREVDRRSNYAVGAEGAQRKIEEFGRVFVRFLQSAGIELRQTENGQWERVSGEQVVGVAQDNELSVID